MEIEDFIPDYAEINDPNYNSSLFAKEEFYSLRTEPFTNEEDKKTKPGEYWNHQELLRRYLSPNTPYMELLVFHKPGTGKTCGSIAVGEMNKYDILIRKPILIVVPNDTLVNQWKNEIAFRCTDGDYIPENYFSTNPNDRLSKLEKKIRLGKKIAPMYHITTIERMRRQIDSLNDKTLRARYSNTLIIVDESHNLRIETHGTKEAANDSKSRYLSFHRLFHVIENSKKILLTGTPVIDRPTEIAGLMNLILPLDKQIPTGKEFKKRFFKKSNGNIELINKEELLNYFKGRVSYVREGGSFPKRIDEGVTTYTNLLKLQLNEMSEFQANACITAYNMDKGIETDRSKGLWKHSRQALNFVYEHNGQAIWGKQASSLLLKKTTKKVSVDKSVIVTNYYTIKDQYKNDIKQNLKKYSIKYYNVIQMMQNEPNVPYYIFTPLVSGAGGALFFGAILQLFGYSRALNQLKNPGKRYAMITGDEKSETIRKQLFDVMNNDSNQNGEYIQCFIGTKSISEGNNLTTVQKEIVLSPYWNNSVTEQAIGRGIRPSSLRYLPKPQRIVYVYQFASVSNLLPPERNLDIHMYRMSEIKDVENKLIERVLKESAWDCAFNYGRNVKDTDVNYSRNCDYQECNYKCMDITPKINDEGNYYYELDPSKIQYNTFLMYYSKQRIEKIKKQIIILLRKYNKIDINRLYESLDIETFKLAVLAIENLIETNTVVYNSYGQQGFLGKYKNILYVSDISNTSAYVHEDGLENSWYSIYPYINKYTSLNDIIDEKIYEKDLRILSKLDLSSFEKVKRSLSRLHIETKIFLVEYLLQLNKSDLTNRQKIILEAFLNVFKNNIFYFDTENLIVHDLQKIRDTDQYVDAEKGEYGSYRCLKNGEWTQCNKKEVEEITKRIEQLKAEKNKDIINNPYKVFAKIQNDVFRIVDKTKEKQTAAQDRRGVYKGKVCTAGWKKEDLIELALRIEMDVVFTRYEKNQSIDSKKRSIQNANLDKFLNDNLNPKQLDILYKLSKMKNPQICILLRKWFEDNGLVIYE